MIEYNSYFGGLLAAAATAASVEGDGEGGGEGGDEGGGLLRVQAVARQAAVYAVAVAAGEGAGAGADTSQGHASLGLQFYSHCSSPIRRYADLHNQVTHPHPNQVTPRWGCSSTRTAHHPSDATRTYTTSTRCSAPYRRARRRRRASPSSTRGANPNPNPP